MNMTLNEFNYLTNTCWNEKHQPLNIDMTKDLYQGRYRLGSNSTFVPDSSPFLNNYSNVIGQDLINIQVDSD